MHGALESAREPAIVPLLGGSLNWLTPSDDPRGDP